MPLVHDLHCQVVDKIHIQMDAFLEDGSHEATISVIRALAVAVPHSTDRLREYILLTTFNFYILTIACMVDLLISVFIHLHINLSSVSFDLAHIF
jgi:hypothetical protein